MINTISTVHGNGSMSDDILVVNKYTIQNKTIQYNEKCNQM